MALENYKIPVFTIKQSKNFSVWDIITLDLDAMSISKYYMYLVRAVKGQKYPTHITFKYIKVKSKAKESPK